MKIQYLKTALFIFLLVFTGNIVNAEHVRDATPNLDRGIVIHHDNFNHNGRHALKKPTAVTHPSAYTDQFINSSSTADLRLEFRRHVALTSNQIRKSIFSIQTREYERCEKIISQVGKTNISRRVEILYEALKIEYGLSINEIVSLCRTFVAHEDIFDTIVLYHFLNLPFDGLPRVASGSFEGDTYSNEQDRKAWDYANSRGNCLVRKYLDDENEPINIFVDLVQLDSIILERLECATTDELKDFTARGIINGTASNN